WWTGASPARIGHDRNAHTPEVLLGRLNGSPAARPQCSSQLDDRVAAFAVPPIPLPYRILSRRVPWGVARESWCCWSILLEGRAGRRAYVPESAYASPQPRCSPSGFLL